MTRSKPPTRTKTLEMTTTARPLGFHPSPHRASAPPIRERGTSSSTPPWEGERYPLASTPAGTPRKRFAASRATTTVPGREGYPTRCPRHWYPQAIVRAGPAHAGLRWRPLRRRSLFSFLDGGDQTAGKTCSPTRPTLPPRTRRTRARRAVVASEDVPAVLEEGSSKSVKVPLRVGSLGGSLGARRP